MPNPGRITNAIQSCRALGELARILQEQSRDLDHIHVSAAWVCLARIGAGRGAGDVTEIFAALHDQTWDVLGQMEARNTASVMHSISKLHQMGERADRGLLEAMQNRATATAGESNPQDVANLLWGLATMGEKADRGLLEAMQKRATATAGGFNPQNVKIGRAHV